MKKVTKNTTIGDVIKQNEKTKAVLMGFGMHCFGCPMSQMETLGEAAQAHEADINLLIEKVNEVLNEPKEVKIAKRIKVKK